MDVILFHADCPDGFCSAYVGHMRFPEALLVPCTHGYDPPIAQCANQRVLVADFSWKREQMLALRAACRELTVLDHHASAKQELEGLPFCQFDMNRSGAAMTWDHLFPLLPRPWFVDYVQDRDLWQHLLWQSKQVSAYIMTLPMTLDAWKVLGMMTVSDAARLGQGIILHIERYTAKVCEHKQTGTLTVEDDRGYIAYTVNVVNAAYPGISEIGNELAKTADIGMGWFQRGDGMVQFSLRSIGNVDVSLVAKAYGGGGHKNAAGFQLPFAEGISLVQSITRKA